MTIDECKEKISFSTKLFLGLGGIIVLIIGGLVNLHLADRIIGVFWAGSVVAVFLSIVSLVVFVHIQKNIKDIGKL